MDEITNNAKVSAAIAQHMANGASVEQAIDEVLGVGTFTMLVSDLYYELKAKVLPPKTWDEAKALLGDSNIYVNNVPGDAFFQLRWRGGISIDMAHEGCVTTFYPN